ncbi:MAG: hypothetical protein D6706_09985 [Chloroflexi bacterium]|nr:MAG: hypothetical protein D6706_09985 [Chloroflexota bacterium]
MLNQKQLQELLAYRGDKGVVSLYLNTDISQETAETIKQQAKSLLREAQPKFAKDVAAIEQYLDYSYDWSTPGLAVFCGDEGAFFRDYPVAVSFRNRIRTGPKPYVKPLAHLLDHYAHYGVILVDRVGARFFEYHLGVLQAQDGHIGEEVQRLKKGRGSSAIGMRGGQEGPRYESEVMQRNLREAAEAAQVFFANRPIRRLFLGGTPENVAQFRELLPKQLLSCMAGTFTIDMNAGEHEVRKQTLALLRQANEERERKLVETLIARQARGEGAVTGLDDTLQAVSDRKVQVLVISDGFRMPGYVHDESGFVVANLARSPFAVDALREVEDVVDTAVALTMSQGGHVEIIADNPDLEKVGKIGALLRY